MKLVATLALASFTLVATATPCLACSCAAFAPKEYAERADVVFTGVVRSISGADFDDGAYGDDITTVRFRVRAVYKGQVRRLANVLTNESDAACGYPFSVGKKYTVFASRGKAKLSTGLCSGTERGGIDPAKFDLGHRYPPKD